MVAAEIDLWMTYYLQPSWEEYFVSKKRYGYHLSVIFLGLFSGDFQEGKIQDRRKGSFCAKKGRVRKSISSFLKVLSLGLMQKNWQNCEKVNFFDKIFQLLNTA